MIKTQKKLVRFTFLQSKPLVFFFILDEKELQSVLDRPQIQDPDLWLESKID